MGWLMISSIVFILLPFSRSQSDTTVFDYTVFNHGDPSLLLQGDALVNPAGGTIAQLIATNNSVFPGIPFRNRAGRIVHSQPIRLWDRAGRRQANFQTRFSVYIGNRGSNINMMGDGISFFIAPVNTTIPQGSAGGHMGLYGSSGSSPTPLFAVELDIFSNSWDPSYRHVGININSRNSVAVERWELVSNEYNVDVRITYDARERLITAFASARPGFSSWTLINATVEHALDLKSLLPEWVQIGISASTGDPVVAQQNIINWSFISFLVPDVDVTDADRSLVLILRRSINK